MGQIAGGRQLVSAKRNALVGNYHGNCRGGGGLPRAAHPPRAEPPGQPRLVSRRSQTPGWPGRLHRVVRQPSSAISPGGVSRRLSHLLADYPMILTQTADCVESLLLEHRESSVVQE